MCKYCGPQGIDEIEVKFHGVLLIKRHKNSTRPVDELVKEVMMELMEEDDLHILRSVNWQEI